MELVANLEALNDEKKRYNHKSGGWCEAPTYFLTAFNTMELVHVTVRKYEDRQLAEEYNTTFRDWGHLRAWVADLHANFILYHRPTQYDPVP